MTWILERLGSYYHRFSPEPDMDEWTNGLIRRFERFSAEEKARFGYSHNRYLANVGNNFEFARNPVAESDWPDVIRLRRKYRTLPDFFHVWYGILMVSAPMRALLEKFDPGVHVFRDIPFDCETDEDYFAFHTPSSLQAIDIEASDPEHVEWFESAKKYRSNYDEIGSAGIAFDAAKTEGRGFWRDSTLHVPCYCISDDFKTALRNRGLSIPKVFKTKAKV